jgi:hypothetical protein
MRPSPRSRSAGADVAKAHGDYLRRQGAEQRAQVATGGGKPDVRAATKSRGQTKTMGQVKTGRDRFGQPSSGDLNRTAKQLHPNAATVRGVATRKPTALPGYRKAAHTADPEPRPTGFAGAFFGGKPPRSVKSRTE